MQINHGNDKYNYSEDIKADFSSNIWHKPPPSWFYNKLSGVLKSTTDYPHPNAKELREQLAIHHKTNTENICITNGSVEGIFLLAQIFATKKSAIITPSFSEYETACQRYNHKINFHSNSEKWFERKITAELVWFGNPNNPDGKIISSNAIERMVVANPNTIFIIDEAFAKLTVAPISVVVLLQRYTNLIVLRSFTKTFSIPGIRLGYILADKQIISNVKTITIPWSVNSLAIEAGKIILKNYSEMLPELEELVELKNYLEVSLKKIQEIKTFPSETNFLLARLKKGNAADLKNFLIKNHGVLIRNASNFRGLAPSYIRLSVQNKTKTNLLIAGLKHYFDEL